MRSLLAYIPSPSTNGLSLGPFRLRVYGLLIAVGVFAAVWLADRRWRARGGAPGTIAAVAVWAVPGGLIGARIYHIVTDYQLYTDHPLNALKIWEGGLGIWGGVAGGVLAGSIYIRRHHLDLAALLDCVAPALPLAQAIGRWGNYFNQELYGRTSHLPWAVKIDNPAGYPPGTTFHPTFLYESLWDLAVVALVLLAERRVRLRKGYLFAVYVALYTFGRFFTEYLRIDNAHRILGLRLNDWVSVIVFATAVAVVMLKGRAGPDDETTGAEAEQPAAGETGAGSESDEPPSPVPPPTRAAGETGAGSESDEPLPPVPPPTRAAGETGAGSESDEPPPPVPPPTRAAGETEAGSESDEPPSPVPQPTPDVAEATPSAAGEESAGSGVGTKGGDQIGTSPGDP